MKWTHDNADLISGVATEPLYNRDLWGQAKEPFEFLQLAIEWNKVVLTKTQHLWFIGVGVDATASGLQLCPQCCETTWDETSNVLPPENPDDPPQDAYLEVLRVARQLAEGRRDTTPRPHLTYRGLGKTMMVQVYGRVGTPSRTGDEGVLNRGSLQESSPKTIADWWRPWWYARVDRCSRKRLTRCRGWRRLGNSPLNRVLRSWSGTLHRETPSVSWFQTEVRDIPTSHLGKVRIPVGKGQTDEEDEVRITSFVHPLL